MQTLRKFGALLPTFRSKSRVSSDHEFKNLQSKSSISHYHVECEKTESRDPIQMKNNKMMAYLFFVPSMLFMVLTAGCLVQNPSQPTETGDENIFTPSVIDGSAATDANDNSVSDERQLDVESEDAEQFAVDQYFSPCLYGPTQHFFTFGDQNVVMVARFSEDNPHFRPSIRINLFSPELSAEQIDKWINNQHSDAIFGDAPRPIDTQFLSQYDYWITSITDYEFIDHTVGDSGDEYDNYRVQFSVSDLTKAGSFNLIGFDAETIVHIRTRGCSTPEHAQPERVLDMSSEAVDIFTVDQYFSSCQYGPTQQFFTFGDQSAVLRVRFSIEQADLRPAISINLFEPGLNAEEIGRWVNNQYSDAVDGDAPKPIYTTIVAQNNYSITSSEFIDHTVGNVGDEYDNYRVQYSVSDVTDGGNFQVKGFDQEAVVHIRTKGCGYSYPWQ